MLWNDIYFLINQTTPPPPHTHTHQKKKKKKPQKYPLLQSIDYD